MGSEADHDPTEESPLSMTWSVGRIAAVVSMLAIVLFWAWVFSGAPAKANPDYLQDRAYAGRLEARCQQLRDDIGELPIAADTPERLERAAVIDQANDLIDGFIADVADDAPTDGRAGKAMDGWLADWRSYLQSRQAYVEQLRANGSDRFTVEKSPLGDTVDKTIEVFAQVNKIEVCATPGDMA